MEKSNIINLADYRAKVVNPSPFRYWTASPSIATIVRLDTRMGWQQGETDGLNAS